MPEPIRVVIADDHETFRRGLNMVLEAEDDIAVVAHAVDGADAIDKVAVHAPDVVLMDVRMPRMSGIEATRTIRQEFPAARIVMLTVSDDDDDLFEAIKAGANGYLLKEISIDEVADAVRAVAGGKSLLSPAMAAKLITEFGALARQASGDELEGSPRLTDREHDVLRHVALGKTNEEIATALNLTETVVRRHVANILMKLQVRSRIEAALKAMEARLFETQEPSG